MFCKPRPGSATRHLFVGNCGPAVGLTELQVQHYFECTGAEAVIVPAPAEAASSHVFVTYKTVAEAEVVLRTLSAKPAAELGNRKLVVKYADQKLNQQAAKVLNAPKIRLLAFGSSTTIYDGLLSCKCCSGDHTPCQQRCSLVQHSWLGFTVRLHHS